MVSSASMLRQRVNFPFLHNKTAFLGSFKRVPNWTLVCPRTLWLDTVRLLSFYFLYVKTVRLCQSLWKGKHSRIIVTGLFRCNLIIVSIFTLCKLRIWNMINLFFFDILILLFCFFHGTGSKLNWPKSSFHNLCLSTETIAFICHVSYSAYRISLISRKYGEESRVQPAIS